MRARDLAGNVSAASAAVTAATAAGQSTGACSVKYRANGWSGGFTGTVQITNTGTTALAGWTLGFTFPSGQTVSNGWNAAWTQTGSAVSAAALSHNSAVAAGGTVEIGFNGTGASTAPTTFTLNNSTCSTT